MKKKKKKKFLIWKIYTARILLWYRSKEILHTSCCRLVNSSRLAIPWSLLGSFWKLSTSRLKARHTLSTLFLSCCVSRFASRESESATKWNSSAWRFWQQLDVMANAARWALILKKSRYIRQAVTPRWKITLHYFQKVNRKKIKEKTVIHVRELKKQIHKYMRYICLLLQN